MNAPRKRFNLKVPQGWQELTPKQLEFIYRIIARGYESDELKMLCVMKFSECDVIGRYGKEGEWIIRHRKTGEEATIRPIQFAEILPAMNWLCDLPNYPIRPERFRGYRAVDATLMGEPFSTYLTVENLYQGYLTTQDDEFLEKIASLLYRCKSLFRRLRKKGDGLKLKKWESIAIFYWVASIKKYFSIQFPDFFQPMNESADTNLLETSIGRRLQENMNAQIRALTKGDITKEKEILEMDTWRALTELNSQAREYHELQAQMKKH